MIYALNVFTLLPGKEDQYRDYSVKAGKIIYGYGGRVVAAGHDPIRHMHGEVLRKCFVVVEFPNEEIFQNFLDDAEEQDLHNMRETATKDYIWTLYTPWDLRAWVKQGRSDE